MTNNQKPKINIGDRIKYFRQRVGMSQVDLELAVDAASGSISRIEGDKVHPTRETILKIAKELDLAEREIDYLNGILAEPASEADILRARAEVRDYFNRRGVLAYLVDDRYRLIDVSRDFFRFLEIDFSLKEMALGKAFIEIILDEKFKIKKAFKSEDFSEVMKNLLERFYSEMGFMVDDIYYKQSINAVNRDPVIKKIWKEIIKNPPSNFHNLEYRRVNFTIGILSIPLFYSNEPLQRNRRFEVVEYTPTNRLIKFLSRIL